MAKTKTTAPVAEEKFEREHTRFSESLSVLSSTEFADQDGDQKPRAMGALQAHASRDALELARQIHVCCSESRWTSYQKRVACEELFKIAFVAIHSINNLADEFPESFQEIAEELPVYPCLFPAHRDDLPLLEKMMREQLKLGRRYALKVRATAGGKTFSKKTPTNQLLVSLIHTVQSVGWSIHDSDPGEKRASRIREVAIYVPLTPENAKKWLEAIWEVLLTVHPEPEKVPHLRQLVSRPSLKKKRMRRDGTVGEKTLAHNTRASIKSKLGTYLRRMLNDSPDLQIEP
jgi:hypothetical protein